MGMRTVLAPTTVDDVARVLALSKGEEPKNPAAPQTMDTWPTEDDYLRVEAWRAWMLRQYKAKPELLVQAKEFYKHRPVQFINHWCDTWDTRNVEIRGENAVSVKKRVRMPMLLFRRQAQLVQFVDGCLAADANGLVEKSRDMGATWVLVSRSNHMFLFWDDAAIGWGSANALKLDRLDDPSSIFEKIRMQLRHIPSVFLPRGWNADEHMMHMRIVNPANGSSITGDVGKNIGRGARTRMYIVDEAAHLEQPEAVEAALSEATRVRIDISSVSGLGTVFHRTRQAGVVWEPGQTMMRAKTNVFIMDWSHHPAKTPEWHDERREYFKAKGLAHVFAREIDRDYAAAVQNVLIPNEWALAAVDAHVKLGFDDTGGWVAGQDVADGGLDQDALVARKGVIVKCAEQWSESDQGATCRRAMAKLQELKATPCQYEYDCIGIGAGIKTEYNRLKADGKVPKGIVAVPWNAAAGVLNPGDNVIPGDESSPRNKEHYANLKAQAWFELRMRFYRTWRAVKFGEVYKPEELISLCSKSIGAILPLLLQELSQPTFGPNTVMKMVVVKAPDGTKSPNLGDACMMCFWPIPQEMMLLGVSGPFAVYGTGERA